jgi:DMSO reductase family type II enzyme heme b subunit
MKNRLLNINRVMALGLSVAVVLAPSMGLAMTLTECLNLIAEGEEPGICFDVFQIQAVKVAAFDIHGGPNGDIGPAVNPDDRTWRDAPLAIVNLPWQIKMDANTPEPKIENSFVNLANPDLKSRVFQVQAIQDGTSIVFKIVFVDRTQDIDISDVPLFHDGLAIGVPYDERTDPLYAPCHPELEFPDMIHMGYPHPGDATHAFCPTQLMFWRADKVEIENVVANGPGTSNETYETDEGIFNTWQSWKSRVWTVLLARPLINTLPPLIPDWFPGNNLVTLVPGESYDIVFANWNGSIQERNGYKYISPWGKLIIE